MRRRTTIGSSSFSRASCTGHPPWRRSARGWSGRRSGPSTSARSSWMPAAGTTRSCCSTSSPKRSPTCWARASLAATERTALHAEHVALGGRMVDFGGWDLPQQYSSIRDEHLAVRTVAGVFDISHMGRFRVTGDGSFEFLQGLLTNDLSRIGYGRAQYNLMCNEAGGILDDLVVYWGEEGFFVVVNAANREQDLDWMRSHAPR